ncbi:MAG: DUF1592 domain-containing protein [Planctomycetota bacterium]
MILRLASVLLPAALGVQDPEALRGFVREHCADCHGAKDPEAGLDLLALSSRAADLSDAPTWIDVRDALLGHQMPPSDEAQPDDTERQLAVSRIAAILDSLAASSRPDPGRVTMRRLSRVEYASTVRDLCDVDVDPTAFPADDLAFGFDNNGDALSLSTLHLEKYAAAAERIASLALPDLDPSTPPLRSIEGADLHSTFPEYVNGDGATLISNGHASAEFVLPRAGHYRVRVKAYASQAGDELARMAIDIDGKRLRTCEVDADRGAPAAFTVECELDTRCEIRAVFLNDFYDPRNPDARRRDRNLFVASIGVEGPLDRRPATPFEGFIAHFEDQRGTARARAARALRALLPRVWRRPPAQAEIDRLARAVGEAVTGGQEFRAAFRTVFAATLLSPHFLFRVEAESSGGDAVEPLADHALAVRLSYFLWSSMPDDALRARADRGRLHTVDALLAEADRLLADPRSDALATVFAAQWLELRRLDQLAPDPARFQDFDPALARSMRRETELLFREVLRSGAPLSRLMLSDHTFVDARLARHYGFAAPQGDDFTAVPVPAGRGTGLLAHASILAVTSHPTRTSPVRRGKWILDELLGAPPPAPLPGKDSFPPETRIDTPAALREQLARHRADPSCAVCHDRIDPLGLALERFDPLGRDRGTDAGIDTRGQLPDGRTIDGLADLAALIAKDPAFPRCVLRKLFVFALGREIMPADALALDRVLSTLPPDPPLRELVLAVIRLDAFRLRSPQRERR